MCILKLKLEHREYFPWKFDLLAFFGGVGGNDGWESFLREFTKLFIVGVSLIRFFTIGKYFSPERDGGGVGVLAFFRIYWLMWTKLCVFRKSCHFFLRWISTLFLYFFFDFFPSSRRKKKSWIKGLELESLHVSLVWMFCARIHIFPCCGVFSYVSSLKHDWGNPISQTLYLFRWAHKHINFPFNHPKMIW